MEANNINVRTFINYFRESGAAQAKSRAAPATVSEEYRSISHWKTGKADQVCRSVSQETDLTM